MDIEIPEAVINRRRRKKAVIYSIGGLILLLFIYSFYNIIKPSVERASLLTAFAEIGAIEATIPASGQVTPLYEQVITSPIEAKIEKVLHFPGETVNAGDAILLLNKEYSLIALDKLKEEQALKKNKITQEKLSLEKSINELESKYEIQKLRVESLNALHEDEKKLIVIGGTTEDKLKQASLNLRVAEQEMKLITKQISNLKSAMVADLKALHHEIRIQEKSIEELERKIDQAEVKVDTEGVVTWVNGDIGTTINPGEQIAKVADLSSFKVEATISDNYASSVNLGGHVIVKIQEKELRGVIQKIQPAVADGIVTFTIALDEEDHEALRPNLRVDVYVVTAFKDEVVRVKNGPFFKGSHDQKVFVISNGLAIRKNVQIGETNFDYVELESGVRPGDEVIISDMSDYTHMEEVVLK